jgi:hypothetical protein
VDRLRDVWVKVSDHRQTLSEIFYTVKKLILLNLDQLREAWGQVSGHRQTLSEIFYTVKN